MTKAAGSPIHVPNLLLVEDNPDDVVITRRALERAHIGNHLTVVEDGEAALELLYREAMQGSDQIGMILLDLGLPKVDGRTVLRKIWDDRRLRHIPVIILTGSDEEDDMVKSYKSGAIAFLRKPVQVDQMLRAVGDLHGFRLLIART